MNEQVTLASLRELKRDARKIVGVVAWDYQMARIADRAGADLVSVGDSIGVNLWGRENVGDISTDELLIISRAVRRGVSRALVSCDLPFGPVQSGVEAAVRTANRFVREAGADLVKLDDAPEHLATLRSLVAAGIPVFAQFGITPQTSLRLGGPPYSPTPALDATIPAALVDQYVDQARELESAGAALLNITGSGEAVGTAVSAAVSIPVLGGLGGGPWLDGRMRMITAAIGYSASALDQEPNTYANVARITFDALTAYADDVRAARQIKGGTPSSS